MAFLLAAKVHIRVNIKNQNEINMLSNELIYVGKVTSATLFITNVSNIRYASMHAHVLMEAGEFALFTQQKRKILCMSWQSNIIPESTRRER